MALSSFVVTMSGLIVSSASSPMASRMIRRSKLPTPAARALKDA
ncbi:hypothetical protein [Rhizobium sp. 21-4511-3d]